MARRKILAGSTSVVVPIFIQDSSSTTGAGLGSLVYNSSGLAAKYRRQGDSSWTTINLVTATAGTFTSSGFIADGGPVTGGYELGIPNAALASGATWVQIALYGATNMLAVLLEIELDAVNYQDATRFGLSALPNANAAANGGLPTVNGNNAVLIQTGTGTGQLDFTSGVVKANATQILGGTIPTPNTTGVPLVDTKYIGGTLQTARDIGSSVLLSSGTGTGQLDITSGVVKANATQLAGQTITAAAGVTFPSSVASPTNITAGTITTATNLTNLPSIPANWITAAGITAGALNGKGDWNTTAPDNTTIGTIATNIGTNGSGLTAIGDTRLNNLDAAVSTRLATAGYTAPDNATITAINSKTTNLPSDPADASDISAAFSAVNTAIAALNDLSANELFTSQMTESYAADGTAPTLAQCLFLIQQSLHEFSISSTSRTVKKLDGSTTAAVFTLDSATAPTSTTRTA